MMINDQSDFCLIKEIYSFLLNAASGKVIQTLPDNLIDFLGNEPTLLLY